MQIAKERGVNPDPLRMAASRLAKRIAQEIASLPTGGSDLGPVLQRAFDGMIGGMKLSDDKKAGMTGAFAAVKDALAALPAARTEPFFTGPESAAKGTGEILALAFDPEVCKGCGVCVTSCDPAALHRGPRGAAEVRDALAIRDLVFTLPGPGADTIARARETASVGPLAGLFLDRDALEVFSGGDGAEAGSGEKIAVRQVLATATHHLKPLAQAQRQAVAELKEELAGTVRERLASALPTRDLDALAEGLEGLERPEVDLNELTGRVEAAFESDRVDTERLRGLVDAARDVGDVLWRLETGALGMGRTLFGLVAADGPSTAWIGTFPYNPTAVPTVMDAGGDAVTTALGVIQGHVQETVEIARVIRRARLELDKPAEAVHARETLLALTWNDLTAAEKAACPPLFVAGNERELAGHGLAALLDLLGSDLPVKVIALSELEMGMGRASGPVTPTEVSGTIRGHLGLLALAHPRSYVLQSSIAVPSHLEAGVAEAVTRSGPALVCVHGPSPERHGFAIDAALERAAAAITARAFPLFRTASNAGDGTTLDLSGNPAPGTDWAAAGAIDRFTPVHWAFDEERFRSELRPLGPADADPVSLADYLELPAAERSGKTPVIAPVEDPPLAVSPGLVRFAEDTLAGWRRLAAWGTPADPAATEPAAEPAAEPAPSREALAVTESRYQAELAALRQSHQIELHELHQTLRREMAVQVRDRLRRLLAGAGGNGKGQS
jgi:pyruvate-ferredoxin/flavodoxin oxidoreductase